MFNLPNLFTAANLISGCIAIILALLGRIDLAPFAIFAGALFDFCDGFIARKLNISGEMGKQLDSLADMVTFGVAPGAIMFVVLAVISEGYLTDVYASTDSKVLFYLDGQVGVKDTVRTMGGLFNNWKDSIINVETYGYSLNRGSLFYAFMPFLALIIPFFSMFRLAKFNLDTRQTESFIGVPTPAATLFFCTFPLVLVYQLPTTVAASEVYSAVLNPITIIGAILLMSLLLVSEIPLFSLKFKSFRIKGNEIRYSFLLISLLFIIVFKAWALALIVFLYLVLSIIENYVLKTKKHEI